MVNRKHLCNQKDVRMPARGKALGQRVRGYREMLLRPLLFGNVAASPIVLESACATRWMSGCLRDAPGACAWESFRAAPARISGNVAASPIVLLFCGETSGSVPYFSNLSYAITAVRTALPRLLLCLARPGATLRQLLKLISTTMEVRRPDRSFPRNRQLVKPTRHRAYKPV